MVLPDYRVSGLDFGWIFNRKVSKSALRPAFGRLEG
jgi:hypothetical protein